MADGKASQKETPSECHPQNDLVEMDPENLMLEYDFAFDRIKEHPTDTVVKAAWERLRTEVIRRLELLEALVTETTPDIAQHLSHGNQLRSRLLNQTKLDRNARYVPAGDPNSEP